MPVVKTKSGEKHFPYTKKGKEEAKEYSKKHSEKMEYKKGKK